MVKSSVCLQNLLNNLFSKTVNSTIDNYDFLKRFGTLYDLLIDLLDEKISISKVAKEQNEMKKKMSEEGLLNQKKKVLMRRKVKVL